MVEEELDETEMILADAERLKRLDKSNAHLRAGNVVKIDLDKTLIVKGLRVVLILHQLHLSNFMNAKKASPRRLKKLLKLIQITVKTTFEGVGKPEQLKYNYIGFWLRRITEKHRFVYQVRDDFISIIECKNHYQD